MERCWWAGCALMLLCSLAMAGRTGIVLRDYLNTAWSREIVLLSFHRVARRLPGRIGRAHQTEGKAVPVQLSHITCWPRSRSVKSATLTFLADLAPLATAVYTVRYGKDATAQAPKTDLEIARTPGMITMTTTRWASACWRGRKRIIPPLSPAQRRCPVLGLQGVRAHQSARCRGKSPRQSLVRRQPALRGAKDCRLHGAGHRRRADFRGSDYPLHLRGWGSPHPYRPPARRQRAGAVGYALQRRPP